MNLLRISLITLLFCLPSFAFSKARIAKIGQTRTFGTENRFFVEYSGDLKKLPEIMVRKNIIQLEMKNTTVWPKIEKRIDMGKRPFDGTLTAYQFNKDVTRFRIIAPQDFVFNSEDIKVTFKKNKIFVDLPKTKKTAFGAPSSKLKKKISQPSQKLKNTPNVISADEELLEKILKSDEDIAKSIARDIGRTAEDKVSTIQSAEKMVIMKKKDRFNVMSYVGKFVAFLALVLVLFYGVIALFKKGLLKKTKLGLLGKSNPVSVLSTTYLGPKRTLLTVKVHDKVLLLASSENGINFLSEVEGGNQVLKDGEREIAGDNFDTNLMTADNIEKNFAIKEDIKSFAKEEKVKKPNIADQIKNKVKGLKELQ